MNKREVLNQLCKMQGEVASLLDVQSCCICDQSVHSTKMLEGAEFPEEVIAWLWEAVYEKTLRMTIREVRSGFRKSWANLDKGA